MNGIIHYLTGPVIGAVIGCFTNYLAVKMLFRPYKEVKLFGFTMPFTPGIIPKRQNDISHAVGTAVGRNLFTGDDLKKILLSEAVRHKASDLFFTELGLKEGMDSSEIPTVAGVAEKILWDDSIENIKYSLSMTLSDLLVSAFKRKEVRELFVEKGVEAIREKKNELGFVGMLVKDSAVRPIVGKFYERIAESLEREGRELIVPMIKDKADALASTPVNQVISEGSARRLQSAFDKIYNDTMTDLIVRFREEIDIAGVVEEKVRAMDVAELEGLCLAVMKKELNSIVWLGAVLGFLIGIINSFL